jgi:hypothetical protein
MIILAKSKKATGVDCFSSICAFIMRNLIKDKPEGAKEQDLENSEMITTSDGASQLQLVLLLDDDRLCMQERYREYGVTAQSIDTDRE